MDINMGIMEGSGKIKDVTRSLSGKLGTVCINGAIKKAIPFVAKFAVKKGLIGKLALSCGKLLGLTAGFMAGPLGPIAGEIVGQVVVYAATKAIGHVAKKLGIIPNDDMEKIGYRMAKADMDPNLRSREDFSSFREYYDYLCQEIPDDSIDAVELEKFKFEYTAMSGEAMRIEVAAYYNMEIPVEMMIEIGRCHLDGESLKSILERFSQEGYNLDRFSDYLHGDLKGKERRQVEALIADIFLKVYPELTENQIKERIKKMCDVVQSDELLAKELNKNESLVKDVL